MADKKTNKSGGTDTLLVELLTEELPPKALKNLSEWFGKFLADDLRRDGLLIGESWKCYATPRRLAVQIQGVLDKGNDIYETARGPSVNAPKEHVAGFARKHGVSVDELQPFETPKGMVFACVVKKEGARLENVLAAKIQDSLKALPVPKIMRWGDGDAQFARPVHGLVMLHGSRIVPGEVLGAKSSNSTLGHRFLAGGAITLKHADDYESALNDKGKVVADFDRRHSEISAQLEKAAGGVKLVMDDALLDEITAIVEAPVVYAGEFSPDFLAVPEECLILSMQQHQKYVPLRDKKTGKLLPRFLFVSNIGTKQPHEIIHGNERVLRARLSDAKFFYDQDRKTRLETRVPRLASVVYHNKLGTQLERVERIRRLSSSIARVLKTDAVATEHAAYLSKADLLTEMVGEFPELQGVMGCYYALHDGESKEIANAVEQHYYPRFAGDIVPNGPISSSVALADKLISLAGLFGIQQEPTGDKDPFGLRRAALGIVRILVENKLELGLDDLIESAFKEFNSLPARANLLVREFIYERFSSYLKDRGYSTLEIEAVLATLPQQLYAVPQKLEAVKTFLALPEAESLAAANKRVDNILKQAQIKGYSYNAPSESELREPAEIALFKALADASSRAKDLLNEGNYAGYLKAFATLKTPVDAFFDKVMVMADQENLRSNRLALLADLRKEMNRVADISKLAT